MACVLKYTIFVGWGTIDFSLSTNLAHTATSSVKCMTAAVEFLDKYDIKFQKQAHVIDKCTKRQLEFIFH